MTNEQAEAEIITLIVDEEDVGARLDRYLAGALPDISRARLTAMIKADAVTKTPPGAVAPSYRIKEHDQFVVTSPPLVDAIPQPEDIPLTVAYEDEHIIVIEKPAGMTVHPAPGQWTGTLVNALLHHCASSLSGIGGVKRPGIVHRIDKDTSGLLVAAKHDLAHQGLSKQFAAHTVERVYMALVWGKPSPATGAVEGAIGRDPRNRKRMAVVHSGGKEARTHYVTEAAFGLGASLLACQLETGRTHQIRVHMAELGYPLIGDPLYGRASKARRARLPELAAEQAANFRRQALHAATLGFIHPIMNESLKFECAPPNDMRELMNALRLSPATE